MWTDELHLYTMIGMDSGTVGAGYALSAGGAAYYTLLVSWPDNAWLRISGFFNLW